MYFPFDPSATRYNPIIFFDFNTTVSLFSHLCTGCADKSLARSNSRCTLFDAENISFDASLVIYINSTKIPPIMIINRIYETQDLLPL